MAKIMVVDGEDSARLFAVAVGKAYGHEVVAVSDAVSAVQTLESEPFDLLVIELRIHGPMNGIALIQEAEVRGWSSRILITNGYAGDLEPEEQAALPRLKGIPVLQKPYNARQFIAHVDYVLGRRTVE